MLGSGHWGSIREEKPSPCSSRQVSGYNDHPHPPSSEMNDLREECMQRRAPVTIKRRQEKLHRVEVRPGPSSGGFQSEHQGKIIPGAETAETKERPGGMKINGLSTAL